MDTHNIHTLQIDDTPLLCGGESHLRPIQLVPENKKHNAANYTNNSYYQNKRPSYFGGKISYGIAAGIQPSPVKYKSQY
jgi:hypothetical protein